MPATAALALIRSLPLLLALAFVAVVGLTPVEFDLSACIGGFIGAAIFTVRNERSRRAL